MEEKSRKKSIDELEKEWKEQEEKEKEQKKARLEAEKQQQIKNDRKSLCAGIVVAIPYIIVLAKTGAFNEGLMKLLVYAVMFSPLFILAWLLISSFLIGGFRRDSGNYDSHPIEPNYVDAQINSARYNCSISDGMKIAQQQYANEMLNYIANKKEDK